MSDVATCHAPGCLSAPREPGRRHCGMHRQRLKKYGVLEPYNCIGCGARLSEGRKFCGECQRLNANLKSRRSRARQVAADPESEMGRRRDAMNKWRKDNPEAWAAIARRNHLRVTYKMSLEEYDQMLADQGGGCAICGTRDGDPSGRRLHVDHDHNCCSGPRSCGKCNRGLLCKACNTGLGGFRDDPDLIRSAIDYLLQRS